MSIYLNQSFIFKTGYKLHRQIGKALQRHSEAI